MSQTSGFSVDPSGYHETTVRRRGLTTSMPPRARHTAARARNRALSWRGRRVVLRLSEAEYGAVFGAAKDAGMTPSRYAAEVSVAAAMQPAAPSQDPPI